MSLKRIRQNFGRKSIRLRLTLFLLAPMAVVITVFSAALFEAFLSNQSEVYDDLLNNYAVDIAERIQVNFFGQLDYPPNILEQENKDFPFDLARIYVQIVSATGRVDNRSTNLETSRLPLTPRDIEKLKARGKFFKTIQHGDIFKDSRTRSSPYRLLSITVFAGPGIGYILQVAAPLEFISKQRSRLRRFIFIALPIVLLLSAIGGLYFADKAFSPVTAIIKKTQQISASNFSDRLPIPPSNDELRDLAETTNELLDRLQKAFNSQERFIGDVSHQLRTPIAILQGEVDLLKSKQRSPEEIIQFTESANQELKHLARMIDDLLLLARVDAGKGRIVMEKVRLDEVSLEAVSRLKPLAEKNNIKIKFDMKMPDNPADCSGFLIDGDPDLLATLFQNLIENAIKYSFADQTVTVMVSCMGSQTQVDVHNFGQTISDDQLAKVFDRFYRGGTQSQTTPGLGLGLALVKRITEVHQGTIEVHSSESEGTRFRVTFA